MSCAGKYSPELDYQFGFNWNRGCILMLLNVLALCIHSIPFLQNGSLLAAHISNAFVPVKYLIHMVAIPFEWSNVRVLWMSTSSILVNQNPKKTWLQFALMKTIHACQIHMLPSSHEMMTTFLGVLCRNLNSSESHSWQAVRSHEWNGTIFSEDIRFIHLNGAQVPL